MRKYIVLFILLLLVGCGPAEEAPELQPADEPVEEPVAVPNETVEIDTSEADELEQKREELKARGRNFTKLPPDIREVTFKTSDSILIYGTHYKRDTENTILLLHMLGKDRSTWDEFAHELQNVYAVLAYDARGHGRSQLSWRDFDDKEFNDMVLDAKAAKKHLNAENLVVIGASIGANTALNFAASDEEVDGVILLSPGLDYRGVKTQQTIKQVTVPVLVVASRGDTYAAESAQKLALSSDYARLLLYDGEEHGTHMLGKDLGLEDEIFAFVEEVFE